LGGKREKINAKAEQWQGFWGDFAGVVGRFLWCRIVVKYVVQGYKLW
jgi:hypothetical protein